MKNKAFVYSTCNKLFVYTYMTFGEWLRLEIKRTELSNAEIARRSGFSATYIGNLVRDFNPNTKDGKGRPSEEAVELVTKATGGNLDDAREAAGYSRLKIDSSLSERDRIWREVEKLPPERRVLAIKQMDAIVDTLKAVPEDKFDYDYKD